jgi:hypothetical protein
VARKALSWLVVPPVCATGVLAAHTVAYTIFGTALGSTHEYLAHVPQVLGVAGIVGLFSVAGATRAPRPSPAPFVALALVAFTLQEHLEQLAHGGGFPMLLTSPLFLTGLALQLPFALLAWLVCRWLLAAAELRVVRRPARLGTYPVSLREPLLACMPGGSDRPVSARGPPPTL